MAESRAILEELRANVGKIWFNSVEVRMLAVLAEFEEKAKPKREATQAEIAKRYGASERMLRYWVSWYTKDGIKGLVDLGGRGAKPRHPREKVEAIMDACLKETRAPAADGGRGAAGRAGRASRANWPRRERGLRVRRRPGPAPARGGA